MKIRDLKDKVLNFKGKGVVLALFLAAVVMFLFSLAMMEFLGPYIRRIDLGRYGYPGIFLLGAAVNSTVLLPVIPSMMPVLVTLTSEYNLFGVVFFYALGATLGEGTSYWGIQIGEWFAEFIKKIWRKLFGKKPPKEKKENSSGNGVFKTVMDRSGLSGVKEAQEKINRGASGKMENWLKKHGGLAVFLLALQPFLPFDLAGLVAGKMKYNYLKFCFFCFLGRMPKYFIIIILLKAGIGFWEKFF